MGSENPIGRSGALAILGALAVGLMHCSSDGDSLSGGGSGGFGGAGAAGGGQAGTGNPPNPPPPPPPPPPEKELESSFLSPVATGRFVWTANPDSGRVALIDAISLEVRILEAGFRPTYLAALSGPESKQQDSAIVLNTQSQDATLLQVQADGDVSSIEFETHQGANAWAVSKQSDWVIAWTDARDLSADPTEGFQDVTVIRPDGDARGAYRLSVGYRPTRVFFSDAADRAFIVTEPGISVIELDPDTGPSVGPLIEVTSNPLEAPASRDVTLTPDGSYALVRRDGSPLVGFVSMTTGARTEIPLSGAVTDLDLNRIGNQAIAVVRESSEVFVLPVPEVVDDPALISVKQIDSETFGSVALPSEPGSALLYTNALANDHLTVINTERGATFLEHRTVALKAPVQAVFPSPNGTHAVVLQSPPGGSQKAGAFSVVPTDVLRAPKIVSLESDPHSVAVNPDGTRALVTVSGGTQHGVYLARMPSLQVDYTALSSPALATGMVPNANKGFVAQEHSEGRVTFVDLTNGNARTLTGFELGAKVVDE